MKLNYILNQKIKYIKSSLLINLLVGCLYLKAQDNIQECDRLVSQITDIIKKIGTKEEAEIKRIINNLNEVKRLIDLSEQYLRFGGSQTALIEKVTEDLVEKITDSPLNFHKKVLVATEQKSISWFKNNLKNPKYKTELESYLFTDNGETIKILIESGVNPNIKDQSGYTPLHLAVKRFDLNTIKRLLNNHANVNAKIKPDVLTWEKESKTTPLLLALKELKNRLSKNNNVIEFGALEKYSKLIEILLKFGADPKMKDDNGQNSIDIAKDILDDIKWINLQKNKDFFLKPQRDISVDTNEFSPDPNKVKMESIISMLVKYAAKNKYVDKISI